MNSMSSANGRRWRYREFAPEDVATLVRDGGITSLQARLLAARGISSWQQAEQFFSPSLAGLSDPFLLKGMSEAVSRLAQARAKRETVCVHGDYDVDGVTAVALLVGFFRAVGILVEYIIPLRLEDGYGLSMDGIDEAVRLGAKVLITVDCGITSVTEAEYCKQQGIDLIVTDHHTPGEAIPDALAVINPLQPGCAAPFRQLAGVGLAFKLAIALRSELRKSGCFKAFPEPNLREQMDLAALGTIADLVPLAGENRIIALYGLRELTVSSRIGIVALKRVAGVDGEVSCTDVGFRLAPRLNAAGRLDDARRGVELLLAEDPECAEQTAWELDAANRERQEIEQGILAEAVARMENDPAVAGRTGIVMASDNWHPGVIGIVASRLVDLYYRPTILVALQDGVGKGSGRSIPPFNLYEALHACSNHLLKFGGHRMAAGLAIMEEDIDRFLDDFDRAAKEDILPEELVPQLWIDAELGPDDICRELPDFTDRLRPFGIGNPEPVFLLKGARVIHARILKDIHIKLRLEMAGREFDAIGFGMADRLIERGCVDIVFCPELNVWNNRERIQLKLKDIRSSEVAGGTC